MNSRNPEPDPTPRAIGAALALVLGAATIVGFIVGIAPGLVLGFFGWHTYGAVVGAAGWGGWYFYTRWARVGGVNLVMIAMSIAGGLGVLISVLLFGTLTAPSASS